MELPYKILQDTVQQIEKNISSYQYDFHIPDTGTIQELQSLAGICTSTSCTRSIFIRVFSSLVHHVKHRRAVRAPNPARCNDAQATRLKIRIAEMFVVIKGYFFLSEKIWNTSMYFISRLKIRYKFNKGIGKLCMNTQHWKRGRREKKFGQRFLHISQVIDRHFEQVLFGGGGVFVSPNIC